MQMMVPRYLEVSIELADAAAVEIPRSGLAGVRHGRLRLDRGSGPPQHGNVRAHLRDVRAVCAPTRQRDRGGRTGQGQAGGTGAAPARSTISNARSTRCRSASNGSATRQALTGPGSAGKSGSGLWARPREFVPPEETRGRERYAPPLDFNPPSGVAEGQRDKPRRVARLHPHQHVRAAVAFRVCQHLAHLADASDRVAANVENDIAGFKTVLGGSAVRIDPGHHKSLAAGTIDLVGRGERQSEMGNVVAVWPPPMYRPWPAFRPASAGA